jgi:putative heme-binding domain-containing protein
MGPDLTSVGRQRSFEYVREALVDPNATLTPGYYTIRVTTRDGKQIAGVQRGFDAFSAQLMDASENFHSYARDEVAKLEREFRSLMPSYAKTLSQAELDHLLAYLTSLRGRGGSN